MPFANYKDFDECVRKNKGKSNPKAYCGYIKHQVEGGRTLLEADALWRFVGEKEALKKEQKEHPSFTKKQVKQIVKDHAKKGSNNKDEKTVDKKELKDIKAAEAEGKITAAEIVAAPIVDLTARNQNARAWNAQRTEMFGRFNSATQAQIDKNLKDLAEQTSKAQQREGLMKQSEAGKISNQQLSQALRTLNEPPAAAGSPVEHVTPTSGQAASQTSNILVKPTPVSTSPVYKQPAAAPTPTDLWSQLEGMLTSAVGPAMAGGLASMQQALTPQGYTTMKSTTAITTTGGSATTQQSTTAATTTGGTATTARSTVAKLPNQYEQLTALGYKIALTSPPASLGQTTPNPPSQLEIVDPTGQVSTIDLTGPLPTITRPLTEPSVGSATPPPGMTWSKEGFPTSGNTLTGAPTMDTLMGSQVVQDTLGNYRQGLEQGTIGTPAPKYDLPGHPAPNAPGGQANPAYGYKATTHPETEATKILQPGETWGQGGYIKEPGAHEDVAGYANANHPTTTTTITGPPTPPAPASKPAEGITAPIMTAPTPTIPNPVSDPSFSHGTQPVEGLKPAAPTQGIAAPIMTAPSPVMQQPAPQAAPTPTLAPAGKPAAELRVSRGAMSNNKQTPFEASTQIDRKFKPTFYQHFKAALGDTTGNKLNLTGTYLDFKSTSNKWRVDEAESGKIIEAINSGKLTMRLAHSKEPERVIGKYKRGIEREDNKECPDGHPDGKHIDFEAEVQPEDPQVRTNIINGYVSDISPGLDAEIFCEKCGEQWGVDGEKHILKSCDHEESEGVLRNIDAKEGSIVVEPAFEGRTPFRPTFSAAMDAAFNSPTRETAPSHPKGTQGVAPAPIDGASNNNEKKEVIKMSQEKLEANRVEAAKTPEPAPPASDEERFRAWKAEGKKYSKMLADYQATMKEFSPHEEPDGDEAVPVQASADSEDEAEGKAEDRKDAAKQSSAGGMAASKQAPKKAEMEGAKVPTSEPRMNADGSVDYKVDTHNLQSAEVTNQQFNAGAQELLTKIRKRWS